jgi:hypothetical protein
MGFTAASASSAETHCGCASWRHTCCSESCLPFYIECFVSVRSICVVTVATNCQALTHSMNVCYTCIVGQARARSFVALSCLFCEYRMFCCGFVKCSIRYKGDGLLLIICTCYSWEMPSNIGLDEYLLNSCLPHSSLSLVQAM